MLVALLALFVSLGGVGYAATKIGTSQIKNGAVTAKKLHKNAVKTRKIANGAVTGPKLAHRSVNWRKVDGSIVTSGTPGVALAGVNVAADGTVRRYFNRLGGAPTVSHHETGVYQIAIPGLVVKSSSSIVLGTLVSQIGEIRVSSVGNGPAVVRTANSAGAAANRAFNYVVLLHL